MSRAVLWRLILPLAGSVLGLTGLMLISIPVVLGQDTPPAQASQAPNLQDSKRQSAKQAFEEGKRLYQEGSKDSRLKAIESFYQAQQLFAELGRQGGESVALFVIGTIYDGLGEKQQALEHYQQALPLRRAARDRRGEAVTLNNLGGVYDDLDEPQQALEHYQQSVLLSRVVRDRHGEAVTLDNIGRVYHSLGEPRKALEYCQQALPLFRAIGDRRGEAVTLNNIGLVYHSLGEPEQALEYYQQHALPLHRTVGDRRGEAVTLDNIGRVYHSLGEPRKALEYYQQALSLRRAARDRRGEAVTLNNLGGVYDDLDEPQQALEHYHQSLLLSRAAGNRRWEAGTLSNLMDHWNQRGYPRLAVFFGKQAINNLQLLRTKIQSLDSALQQTFLKSVAHNYRYLAYILIASGRLPEAQQVLDMLKEEEYFEFIRRDKREIDRLATRADLTPKEAEACKRYTAIADRLTTLGRRFGELDSKRRRLEKGETLPEPEQAEYGKLTAGLAAANQVFELFLRQLPEEFQSPKEANSEVEAVRETKGLQSDLKRWGEGTVVLQTIVAEDRYHVILTTPNVQLARISRIKAADLNRKVLQFREAVENPKSDPLPLARELYDILLKPVEQDLAGAEAKALIWSLDGTLRYLPIAALHDGQQYVAERYRQAIITLASRTRLSEQPLKAQWRGLGLGVSERWPGFDPLYHVVAELKGVIREEGIPSAGEKGIVPGHRLLDRAFTQQSMEESLGRGYSFVHIASHFNFRPGNEIHSYLLLGDGQKMTLDAIRTAPITLFEGTELLTLSACNTATGSAMGEDGREVEGFAVIAQQQGAKAVIATLWPVADKSTPLLMQAFYRYLIEHPSESKAEGLRQAQLALLRRTGLAQAPYSHPYFWAPFILIGNWQ